MRKGRNFKDSKTCFKCSSPFILSRITHESASPRGPEIGQNPQKRLFFGSFLLIPAKKIADGRLRMDFPGLILSVIGKISHFQGFYQSAKTAPLLIRLESTGRSDILKKSDAQVVN